MKVKSLEASARSYIRKSTQAYLEGEKNLNWIKGVIQSSMPFPEAHVILADLRGYGDPARYEQLESWIRSEQRGLPH